MVLELDNQSFLNGVKFLEAGYVYICDGEEINIYDGCTVTITISQ